MRGEILQLKEAINTMVDQLRSFASEVTRVAHEVRTDGRLGGQAVVPGVAGTWKDLTDSVNAMASNVTTEQQVHRAAELAHLNDEILQMPNGYETIVFERGQNVSGGQKQRLAIARILLKKSPILILDEATSALDNISERTVQHLLGITSKDRTTIIIAHRLSTLKECDRILVFDEGRIAEQGMYDELVRHGGIFAELVATGEGSRMEANEDTDA